MVETAATATKPTEELRRQKQGRSPAYPGIDLGKALEKAKAFYDREGKYAAPMPSAFAAWGFSAKSSGAREVRAALRYFGLITIDGDGETGKVKLTDKALRILLDEREDQSEKRALIRELALAPAIHKRLIAQFPDGIKSDATVEHFLVFEEGYNKSAAGELVAEFKATADYAELFKPDNMLVKADIKSGGEPPSPPEVGDLVQVEINGAFQLPKPVRVRAIREHGDQNWIFVDGSEAGIPMEQVIVQAKAAPPAVIAATPPRLPESAPEIATQKNEREWLRGPLSKETTYRLIVTGDLGPKEIGKLIKLLKAQQAVLSDDEEEEDEAANRGGQ